MNKLMFSLVMIAGLGSLVDLQAGWFSSKSETQKKKEAAEAYHACKKNCEKKCESCEKCTWSADYTVSDCVELCVQDDCDKGPKNSGKK